MTGASVPKMVGLLVLSALVSGCSALPGVGGFDSSGAMSLRSLVADRVDLPLSWDTACFAPAARTPDGLNLPSTSFYFSDIPLPELMSGEVRTGQLIHIDLLWRPKPGQTPMDSSATNAALMVILVTDGRVGVYGGAGFATISGSPAAVADGATIALKIHDSTLRLVSATDGFADLLSPAILTGSATATRDEQTARQYYMAASQFVTNALGRSTYVNASSTP